MLANSVNNNYMGNTNSFDDVETYGFVGVETKSCKRTSSPKTTKALKTHGMPYSEHNVNNDSKQLALVRQSCYCDQKSRAHNVCHMNGSANLTALPVNNQLTHIINSLSSPESAYSTGYSTDGTSPGKTCSSYISQRLYYLLCL